MRILVAAIIAAGTMITAAPASAQTEDVLAPARQGQLQCFAPDDARKTCQSLGGYAFRADGVIENAAQILVMPSPAIIMSVTSPVTVRNNAICGPLVEADINRATFTINGHPASEEHTTMMRSQLLSQMAEVLNVESCLTMTRGDDQSYLAETSMGGVVRPELGQRVLWVRPNDGWTVAP